MLIGAVLVAAGSGRRMGTDKLWIEFSGRPAWRWGLDTLLAVPGMSWVVVVAPADALDRFRDAIPEAARGKCEVVAGGEERADSALAGIAALTKAGFPEDAAVLIHDAARPAASSELMARIVAGRHPDRWRRPGGQAPRLAEARGQLGEGRRRLRARGAGPGPDAAGRNAWSCCGPRSRRRRPGDGR